MTIWLLTVALAAAPLVDAVKRHDVTAVRAILKTGADVNAAEGDGTTALHWAVYGDHLDLVDALIAAGAAVDRANDLGVTPLSLASTNGNTTIVGRLLQRGANPNAASETGITAVMEAARAGAASVVRALVARGADVNARESGRGQTALMWAAARRQTEVVRALIESGADPNARTTPRTLTVMRDRGPSRTVKTSTQDASQMEAGGSTPLHFAALSGDAESAALLLAAGARIDTAAADGNVPLTLAAFSGHSGVARLLVEKGANPNASGAGYTALHAAVLRGDLATARALLAHGADANARISRGSPVRRFGSQWALPTALVGATPLLVAATHLEIDIARALLEAGADPQGGLPNGTTPLMAAAGASIETEARPSDLQRWNVADNDTPVVPRAENEVLEATRLMLDAGADVNQANAAGDTALHAAATAGVTSVIQLLADRGAVLSARNKLNQTPLTLTLPRGAQQQGRPATPGLKAAEELLRRLGATP